MEDFVREVVLPVVFSFWKSLSFFIIFVIFFKAGLSKLGQLSPTQFLVATVVLDSLFKILLEFAALFRRVVQTGSVPGANHRSILYFKMLIYSL